MGSMNAGLADDVRPLAARLLAHFTHAGEVRLEPGAWVLGDWNFTPGPWRTTAKADRRLA